MDVKLFLNKIKELAGMAIELDTEDTEAEAPKEVEAVVEETVEAAPEVVAEVVVEEPVEEVVLEEAPDFVTRGELEEAVNTLKSLFSKHMEKLELEKVELQKQLDEKPDAEVITHTPKVELKQVPAKDSKGRITQFLNSKK